MDANTLRKAQALANRVDRLKQVIRSLSTKQQMDNEPLEACHLRTLRYALTHLKGVAPEIIEVLHTTATQALTDELGKAKKELEAL